MSDPTSKTHGHGRAWNGLPPNPEVCGWHWLRFVGAHGLSPWYWDASNEAWDTDDCGSADYMSGRCEYAAPCPYPQGSDGCC